MKMLDLMYFGIGVFKHSLKGDVMSTQKQEQSVVTPASNCAIWCPESNIAIYGTELISDKLINLIRTALKTEEEHGINVIRFTQDLPKQAEVDEDNKPTGKWIDCLAGYDFEGRTAVINLSSHLASAVDKIVSQSHMMRIGSYIHINMVISIFHELYHSHKLIDADNPYIVDNAADDDLFENMAKNLVVELAKTINIEAPAVEAESPIIKAFIEEFEEDAMTSDEEWGKAYRDLVEKGIVTKDGEHEHATLRLYYKHWSGVTDADEKNWPEEVHEVTAESFNTNLPTSVAPIQTTPIAPSAIDAEEEPDYGAGAYDETPTIIPGIVNAAPVAPAQVPETPTTAETVAPVAPTVGVPPVVGTQAAPVTPTAPVHSVAPADQLEFIKQLSLRLFDGIFGWGGFQPDATGNPAVAHMGFTTPTGVFNFIPVHDIPFAKELIVSCNTVDEQTGQSITVDVWNPQVANWPAGHIRGLVWNKAEGGALPGYVIGFNFGGTVQTRSFAPQNPNKRHENGALKGWAAGARAGDMRLMLFNDQAAPSDTIQLTVLNSADGSKIREVEYTPMNKATRRLL